MRRSIQRLHSAAVKVAGGEKRLYLYNHLVSTFDLIRFPQQPATHQKDAIQRAAASALAGPGRLSTREQKAAVRIVRSELSSIAAHEQTELLQLSRDIEVVTLECVIGKMTEMIEAKLTELKWQAFFRANPFILRLAFGPPIVIFQDQAAVGGGQFKNCGVKIADFVVESGAFGNLAIIEIKTTEIGLDDNKWYRRGVHAPTKELSGGVSQVLDQRYMLATEIDHLKARSHKPKIFTYTIK